MSKKKASILLTILLVWLACAVLYGIFAQDGPSTYVLLNNSGQDIQVEVDGISVKISSGESGDVAKDPRKLMPFFVQTQEGSRAKLTWMPIHDFRRFLHRRRIYWQIEPDLKVYLLEPTPTSPVKQLPQQPPGYPLAPG